jgi:hypothetical protein
MRQLSRFLRLERVRRESEHEEPAGPSRFSTLETPPAGPAAHHSSPGLERFVPEPAPPPEVELELELPDAGEPFVRCPHCGADSVRHATLCRQCEARLDTDDVRAFNTRLWAEMTAAREREAQESREQQALRQGPNAGTAVSDDASLAELAAREEARRALERPSGWTSSDVWGRGLGSSPRVLPLLVGAALGLPVFFGFFRRGVAGGWAVFLFALGALAVLALRRRR